MPIFKFFRKFPPKLIPSNRPQFDSVVVLDKDIDADDKKTSLIVTSSQGRDVIDLNRDVIDVKTSHHRVPAPATANGSKPHNGSSTGNTFFYGD
jgi:hypothetical protein